MKVHVFECDMLAPLSIRDTFSVFENPYNLAKITPPWLHFKILTPNLKMRKGAEIRYSLAWMRLPMHWKTRITEYEPPFLFVDEMEKGPYSLWRHRHTFRPSEKGTVISDHVEYALPFGLLGTMAHTLMVRRQVEEIFLYRQRALNGIFMEMTARPLAVP
jgi:ligand-binding SRPBCC domain-containing protein